MSKDDSDDLLNPTSLKGELCDFVQLVVASGYRNVITTNAPPIIYLHDAPSDAVVIENCVPRYFVAMEGLASDETIRSRQILARVSALGDWAATEIVERRLRDEEREETGYHLIKPRLTGRQMLVLRFLRQNPWSTRAEIQGAVVAGTGDINQQIDDLVGRDILECSADGSLLTLSDLELQRYRATLAELSSGRANGPLET